MTYALEIRTEKRPAPADGFAISDLWMVPIVLLVLIFDRFSRHLSSLKQMRRTRPMRTDWQGFYPDLRKSEWAIHMFCFEGARQVILGEELDLRAISFDPEPPETFQPPMPRSALAMHQRMQDLARFHADPERYVRRHAERIRGRDCDHDQDRDRTQVSDSPIAHSLANPIAVPVAVGIRGPPWERASNVKSIISRTRSPICENEDPCPTIRSCGA